VYALLISGGYEGKLVVPAGQLLLLLERVSPMDAAGLPDVVCTVWSTVFGCNHRNTDTTGRTVYNRSVTIYQNLELLLCSLNRCDGNASVEQILEMGRHGKKEGQQEIVCTIARKPELCKKKLTKRT
jgi:hypothetical protein